MAACSGNTWRRRSLLAPAAALAGALGAAFAGAAGAAASTGEVLAAQKISSLAGGFAGPLDSSDFFGRSMLSPGDLDGDGVSDLIVGAIGDDGEDPFEDTERGAVWILYLNADGTVKAQLRISQAAGGFGGDLAVGDQFGSALAWLGDRDGDGTMELAVGAFGADDGGAGRGALWILSLDDAETVVAESRISAAAGGFGGALDDGDQFGAAVAVVGDLDGNGFAELAIGAPGDDGTGGPGGTSVQQGAVWILFMGAAGAVLDQRRIADGDGGFAADFGTFDLFGWGLAALGDLDGDGRPELAASAPVTNEGGQRRGAFWILSLEPDGTAGGQVKIGSGQGGFAGALDDNDDFGYSLAAPGDLDRDGIADLLAGAFGDDDGGLNAGGAWVLFLRADGTVRDEQKISEGNGGFGGGLGTYDRFGASAAGLGDLDGDGLADVAVGATGDDDGGPGRGAAWVLFLDGRPSCLWDCGGGTPDGQVAILDLLILLSQWGGDGSCELDGDGAVGVLDLLELLGLWGPCP